MIFRNFNIPYYYIQKKRNKNKQKNYNKQNHEYF